MSERRLERARVVVTRPERPDGALSTLLRDAGATPVLWPAVAIAPAAELAPLVDALERLDEFDWIAFTSPRAVEATLALREAPPRRCLVAAVGAATARALAAGHWPVDLLPTASSGSRLAEELVRYCPSGSRVLFPASSIARRELPERLAAQDVVVEQLEAYRTEPAALDRAACAAAIRAGEVDAVTFASPSAVSGLHEALGAELFEELLAAVHAVAIGATTAAALERLGHTASVAGESSLAGLAEAAIARFEARRPSLVYLGEE